MIDKSAASINSTPRSFVLSHEARSAQSVDLKVVNRLFHAPPYVRGEIGAI